MSEKHIGDLCHDDFILEMAIKMSAERISKMEKTINNLAEAVEALMNEVTSMRRTLTMTKVEWRPYPENKPDSDKWYLVTTQFDGYDSIMIALFRSSQFGEYWVMPSEDVTVTAWAELPEPYKRGCDEQGNP